VQNQVGQECSKSIVCTELLRFRENHFRRYKLLGKSRETPEIFDMDVDLAKR
jgi:hypothetical protein